MTTPEMIDITPTWGAIGTLFYRLAVSKETKAIRHAAPEIARAFAMAQAMSDLYGELTAEQRAHVDATIRRECAAQGHPQTVKGDTL